MKFPILIYQDLAFEQETRKGLKQTFEALVKLLDVWNSLEVGQCDNYLSLVNNAASVYTEAFNSTVECPGNIGKYQISREAFLNVVEAPIPNNLYVAAKAVQKTPCFGYPDIWSVVGGKIIEDAEAREAVIHSRNIYANNEHQKELAIGVIEYVRLSNYLDAQFKEIPWQYVPAPPWIMVGRSFPHLSMLTLEIEQLRVILKKLE